MSANCGACSRSALRSAASIAILGSVAIRGQQFYELIELDGIDIEMPAHVAACLLEQAFAERREIALQRWPRRRLDEELGALHAGAPRDDVGNRVVHANAVRNLDERCGFGKKAHRLFQLARLGTQCGLEQERRETGA